MKTRISYLCVSLTLLSTLNSAQRRAGSSRRSQAKAEAQRRRINPNPLYATKTLMAFSVLLGLAFSAFAQGTAFSYQGRLNDGGNPANGTYDLRFALYDSTNSPGVLIAGPLTNSAAGVTNGLFTVTLDFGTNVFTGQDCWLEIAVRTNGDVGDFSVLSPRQKLTSAPYATRAANFSGAVSDSQLSANVARLDANQTFSGAVTLNNRSNSYAGSFTGNGAGLTNVPGAVPWHYFFGNSVLAEPNTAYVVNLASQTIVLPTQPNSYDMVHVYGAGPGGWQVVASPGQVINNGISPGVIWTPRDSPREWWSVASSADGGKLAAVVLGGQIYTSTDGGATWIARDSNRYWYSIASSSDGSKLAAVAGGELNADRIYTSTDSGVTWTPRETNRTWYAIASSADGSRLVAVVANGQIYTSTDGGTNWIARASSNTWCAVASSADGSKLVAAAGAYAPGQIYTSTDGGTNWTLQSLPSRNWWSVASSADGSKLALVQNSG